MACQVLNRFGIYRRMNKIGDVSMPQLMGCYLKVQTVNHFSVMSSLFSCPHTRFAGQKNNLYNGKG